MEKKFRAWDIANRIWLSHRETIELVNDWNGSFNIDGYIIVQYTGLKDKNGKEIYEGDIVNVEVSHGVTPPNLAKAIVKFVDLSWRFELLEKHDEEDCYAKEYFNGRTEVIGNIYENPELLSSNGKL